MAKKEQKSKKLPGRLPTRVEINLMIAQEAYLSELALKQMDIPIKMTWQDLQKHIPIKEQGKVFRYISATMTAAWKSGFKHGVFQQ